MSTYTSTQFATAAFIVITLVYNGKCTNDWENEMVLDLKGHFHMFWNLSTENIIIEIQVRTKGYVALGFSPHGGMKGADIVTGWVQDSQVYIQDRYGTGNVEPLIDDIQDYELISGFENDTHTVLQFKRQRETCDTQDLTILDDVMHIIYAWSTEDPTSETKIQYHGAKNRGTKSLKLISPNVTDFQLTDDMIPLDFQMPQVTIPPQETTYFCQYFKLPETEKNHLVGIQVVLQPGNENLVHHVMVNLCSNNFTAENDSQLNGPGFDCSKDVSCHLQIVGWNVGKPGETLPPDVGFPIGEVHKPTYYMIAVHYNNPSRQSGIVDQTTIRMFIAAKLRKYDAGMLTVGTQPEFGTSLIIPPHQENFTLAAILPSECTKNMIREDGINIFQAFLHAHLAAKKMHIRHFRDGVELPLIAFDNNFEFNHQYRASLLNEVKVLPGDVLAVQCEYNTMNRTNLTLGGPGTSDEMCNMYLNFYPQTNLLVTWKTGPNEELLHILKTAERQAHNKIPDGYNEMSEEEYMKAFDASILTKQDISDLSYLQTYGRMQGICIGHDDVMVQYDTQYPKNVSKGIAYEPTMCQKSKKEH